MNSAVSAFGTEGKLAVAILCNLNRDDFVSLPARHFQRTDTKEIHLHLSNGKALAGPSWGWFVWEFQ